VKRNITGGSRSDELGSYDRHMRVLELTDAVACGDDVDHGKPHSGLFRVILKKLRTQDPSRAVAPGDTPYDARGALPLGFRVIGVLTGGFTREELKGAGCEEVLQEARNLLDYLSTD